MSSQMSFIYVFGLQSCANLDRVSLLDLSSVQPKLEVGKCHRAKVVIKTRVRELCGNFIRSNNTNNTIKAKRVDVDGCRRNLWGPGIWGVITARTPPSLY